jgi:hypothetical protein
MVGDLLVRATRMITEAERIKLAIELLRDLDKHFIAGLLSSIKDAAEQLKSSFRSNELDIRSFPNLDHEGVPVRFALPKTEQSLIDWVNFRKLLEQWSKSVLENNIQGSWKTRLVDRAIRGLPFDPAVDDKKQKLIRLEPRWVPQNSDARAQMGNATEAGFVITADVQDFYDQASTMLSEHSGSLSDQINMGLRNYVENVASPAERDRRRKAFEAALLASLRYCGPKATQNEELLELIHPLSAPGFFISFSTIPFENTPLEAISRELILAYEPSNYLARSSDSFNSSESIQKIEFYSVLKRPSSPMVFDSLMAPIAADWKSKSGNAAGRQQFWSGRRTKPLLESIPATQENIERMITGWFALAFTGARKYEEDLNLGPKSFVYSRVRSAWVNFPHPLLGLPEPYADHDMLPAVLISLNIAQVQVNEQKNINPLVPYQTLIQAGSIDPNHGYKSIIQDFIDGKGLNPDALHPEVRREKLISSLADSLKYFEEISKAVEAAKDPFLVPRIFELKNPVLMSFAALTEVAEQCKPTFGGIRG